PEGTIATAGRALNTDVANRISSTSPMTNSGTAVRTSRTACDAWSKGRSRRSALYDPSRSASGIAIAAEQSTSVSDASARSRRSAPTDCPEVSESPSEPESTFPSQCAYWLGSERSRPSRCRSAASCAGCAPCPRICTAGSPGSACVAAKTRVETPRRTSTLKSTRRRIQRPGPGRPARPSGARRSVSGPSGWSGGSGDSAPDIAGLREVELVDLAAPEPPRGLVDGLDPAELLRVRVDRVLERPDQVAAALVLDPLHLVHE